MTKTNWNRIIPHSLVQALELTREHGKEKRQLSVQRLADHLGSGDSSVYKWLGCATLPVNKLIALEQACGKNYVTQYLAHSQGFLLVKAPTGRKAENKELTDMQVFMTQVSALLINSYHGHQDVQQTLDGIKKLMEDLAFHQRNIEKLDEPQMSLVAND